MKYRRLTSEELAELETEFVQFLASNQITADEWQKLKEDKPGKVDELIAIFSDIVFDKILRETSYLEYRESNDLKTFYCGPDKIIMLGVFVEGESDLDFTQNFSPEEMLSRMRNSAARLKLYQAEKSYKGDREAELFRMMEGGALISKDGKLFKTLQSLQG